MEHYNESTVCTRTVSLASDTSLTEEELRQRLGFDRTASDDFGRLRTLGLGGVGAVFTGMEPGLRRQVALKMLRSEYRSKARYVDDFIREARTTAQIEHPNIVPVHRIGYSPSAGIYFTMKRIEGRDLRSIIRGLRDKDPEMAAYADISRRLEIFISICQGMAYAHSKGVVHCDLKPANVMIGDFGEVMIMDWGLSIFRQEHVTEKRGQHISLEYTRTVRIPAEDSPNRDLPPGAVRVFGTPVFMSPEQASGCHELLDERSDIYSLGAILYCLLTLTDAPVEPNRSTAEVLRDVEGGHFLRPRRRAPFRQIPRELEAIVLKAMSLERKDRYSSAAELLTDVRNFWHNFPVSAVRQSWFYRLRKLCLRRPLIPLVLLAGGLVAGGIWGAEAIHEYSRKQEQLKSIRYSMEHADAYYRLALRTYHNNQRGIHTVQHREYIRQNLEFFNYSSAALDDISSMEYGQTLTPAEKKQMLQMLDQLIRQQIKFCRAVDAADSLQPIVRKFRHRWNAYRPDFMAMDPELVRMLRRISRGQAVWSLELPEHTVSAIRRIDPDRSAPGEWTPVREKVQWGIPAASYLLRIQYPDGSMVFFPEDLSPGEYRKRDLRYLPVPPPGFALVPQGRFLTGSVQGNSMRRGYLPDYFIQKHEVTIGEYLEFWKQLKDPETKRICRAVMPVIGEKGRYLWDERGNLLPPLTADLPVTSISGAAAELYCRYMSRKTGLAYRLPTRQEWEKAARGADGRTYVWGSRLSAVKALNADHPDAGKYPFGAPPGSFPMDCSVYGVMDMAGNVREIVRDPDESGPIYSVKGGSRLCKASGMAAYQRGSIAAGAEDVGFRCVITMPSRTAKNISGDRKK